MKIFGMPKVCRYFSIKQFYYLRLIKLKSCLLVDYLAQLVASTSFHPIFMSWVRLSRDIVRAPMLRLYMKKYQWKYFRFTRMNTVYILAAGSMTIPTPSYFINHSKKLLNEEEISCPIHCYHEPLRDQVNRLKEEVRPRTPLLCIVIGIRKVLSTFHLILRTVQIGIVFTPLIFTSWFLLFSKLRCKWYRLLVYTLQIGGSSFMKLGQWAATRLDLIPIELCKQLSTLHSMTPFSDFDSIICVLEKELGKKWYEVFDEIEETPLGSGCIAQVHRARIKGSNNYVALKIKKPDVDFNFTQDLQLMNFVAKSVSYLPYMQFVTPDEVARLFTGVMYQQLDFRIEAINLIRFRENFRDDDQFTFPEPYLNLTTKSLLVESYEEGIPLSSILAHPEPRYTNVAHLGLLGFLHMMLVDNFLHADLHPGNILVRESVPCRVPLTKSISHRSFGLQETHPQLVFLDSGLVNTLEPSQKQNFVDLFIALSKGNGYEAGKLLIDRAPQPSPPAVDPEGFMKEIEDLVNSNMDGGVFNLSKLQVANALTKMMTSSLSHHVSLDSRFVNLFMSVVILEGVGRQLDKNLNIISAALPIIRYSIPEYEKAAMSAFKTSNFARRSLYASVDSWLKSVLRKMSQRFMGKKTLDPQVDNDEFFKLEEGVDEKGSALISIYDRIEKSEKIV